MANRKAKKAEDKPETSLVLRCCNPDMSSQNGFVWPSEIGAVAIAPDWKPTQKCGNGLHGWLYGQGDHNTSNYIGDPDAKWLVVEVVSSEIIMLGGKCKFPQGIVRFVGDKTAAAAYMIENEQKAQNVAVIGASISVGDKQTAMVGAFGTSTSGYRGTSTSGEKGEIRIQWWDAKSERYRIEIAYVGENGIEPNVAYKLDENHKFVKATGAA